MTKKDNSDCWLWAHTLTHNGYGVFHRDDVTYLGHRLVYEAFKGVIPVGLELDHLCKIRHCVNPEHLEPVTHKENQRRAGFKRNNGKFAKSE